MAFYNRWSILGQTFPEQFLPAYLLLQKRPKTFQRLHFLIPEVSDLFSTKMLSGPSAETKRAFAIFFVVFLWPKSNDDDDGSMLINTELNHVFTTSKWQLMLSFLKLHILIVEYITRLICQQEKTFKN